MTAKVSSASQRATPADRKVVFRSVLDNPYKVLWPYIPINVQNVVLASLATLLSELGDYYSSKRQMNRKRKRAELNNRRKEKASTRKRPKTDHEENNEIQKGDKKETEIEVSKETKDNESGMKENSRVNTDLPETPPIAAHLTIGINSVTKRLEAQARSLRTKTSISTPDNCNPSITSVEHSPITYVFVCRADVDPPLLISHLPELIAACNFTVPSRPLRPVYLITLPKRAESTLAAIIGLPRVSIVALDDKTPGLETVTCHISNIQPPSASWLTSAAENLSITYEPSQIKQIRTTAPKDMRMKKRERTEGRKTAKERRKERMKCGAQSERTATGTDKSTATKPSHKSNRKRKIRISAHDFSMPDEAEDTGPS